MHHYGYSEADCLNHGIAWMNYAMEVHAQDELDRLRLRERLRLQAALIPGVMFNDPEKGMELYETMVGKLADDGQDESDEAWLSNPHATMDANSLSQLEQTIARRIDDQRRAGLRTDTPSDGTTPRDASGTDTGNTA